LGKVNNTGSAIGVLDDCPFLVIVVGDVCVIVTVGTSEGVRKDVVSLTLGALEPIFVF
jgi:hypothetical protein